MLLLERESALSMLQERLQRLRGERGAGACVLVHGEAGVGKTALLREAERRAGGSADWLWGGCEALLAPPPLAPLLDWLDRLPPSLAAAVRSGRQPGEVMAGMLSLLREPARPLVLVVDDLQWADGATLDLLRYLGRRIVDTRALLVLAWRDSDGGGGDEPVRALVGALPSHSTLRLTLPLLSRTAVEALALAAGRDGRELYRVTQGNAFFVTELLDGAAGQLPLAVRDAVLSRAVPLPAPARQLLDLVSVVPGGLELALVDDVLEDAAVAVDQCAAAGLLQREGGSVRFRHELARGSIESALPEGRRQALHAALFDTLSLHGAAAARLVHHAEHAGLARPVLQLAPLAADEAAQARSYREAADLYALALRHAQALDDAERARLHRAHAEQCLLANRLDAALAAREAALALHQRLGDRFAEGVERRHIARLHWLAGRVPAGKAQALAAIEGLAGLPGAEREHAMALATLGQLHMLDETADAAIAWAARALPLFEARDDAEGLTYALNTLGGATLRSTDEPAAWAQMERCLALALQHGLLEHALRAYVNLASVALVHRRFELLDRACSEGRAYCEAQDIDLFAARLTIRAAHGQVARGQFAEASVRLHELRNGPALPALEDEQSTYALALVSLRTGDGDGDTYWREMVDGRRRLGVDPWYAPQAVLRAEAAWLQGDDAAVRRIVAESLPAALASREGWRIGQLACWAQRVGAAWPVEVQATLAEPCRLELAGELAAAAAAWAARGCRFEQALVLLGGGEVLLREALALLDAMAAAPAARVARRRLRHLGVRDLARGPIQRTRADELGLTPRERAVLELLREGLSNRQIAQRLVRSERTVENHVAGLLAKLGVATRAEAVARTARR